MVGIIEKCIWRVFDEVNDKSEDVIDEIF